MLEGVDGTSVQREGCRGAVLMIGEGTSALMKPCSWGSEVDGPLTKLVRVSHCT